MVFSGDLFLDTSFFKVVPLNSGMKNKDLKIVGIIGPLRLPQKNLNKQQTHLNNCILTRHVVVSPPKKGQKKKFISP